MKRVDSIRSVRSDVSGMSILSEGSQINNSKSREKEFVPRQPTYSEIMTHYNPKWLAYSGFTASFFCSFSLPMFGFVLSRYIFLLGLNPVTQRALFIQQRDLWTWVFAVLCVGIGLSTYIQKLSFNLGGENLTYKIRVMLFESILMKHVGWFDSKDRAPGVLVNTITEDITKLNGLTTEALGIIVEASVGMTVSAAICFYFTWQLGLVVTAVSPLMALGGLGMSKLQFNQKGVDDAYKHANALLSDIVINYRTIISFGPKNVEYILARYGELLEIPHEAGVKKAHYSGLFFGYSQSIRFVFIAFVFYVAFIFVKVYNISSKDAFTGCYVVFVGSIGAGVSLSQLPSVAGAQNSAKKIFGIIEEPT